MKLQAVRPAPPGRDDLLDDILGLSERMLEAARAARWEALADAESERQRLVWAFFATPLTARESSGLAARLERVLGISQELSRLGQAERKRIAGEIEHLDQGRRAQLAYAAHAR